MNEELKESIRSALSEQPEYGVLMAEMSADNIALLLESVPM